MFIPIWFLIFVAVVVLLFWAHRDIPDPNGIMNYIAWLAMWGVIILGVGITIGKYLL